MPEGDDTHLFSLESDSGGGWDQFAVNRDKFGVVTTFNEEFYTTRLDKVRGRLCGGGRGPFVCGGEGGAPGVIYGPFVCEG